MFVGLKKRLRYMLECSVSKGPQLELFQYVLGYWAEYIFKPRPQYGILVFLRSSLPTCTPLFKWESSHWGWMIGNLHDRKKRLKGSTDSGRLCVALATLTYYFLDLLSTKWSANTRSDWSQQETSFRVLPNNFSGRHWTLLFKYCASFKLTLHCTFCFDKVIN